MKVESFRNSIYFNSESGRATIDGSRIFLEVAIIFFKFLNGAIYFSSQGGITITG